MRYWVFAALFIILVLGIVFFIVLDLQYRVLFNPSFSFAENIFPADYQPKDLFLSVRTLETSPRIDSTTQISDKYSIHLLHFERDPALKTILFCHGNSGNISHRDYIINFCYHYKVNLLLFDYRGYGYSGGYATQRKICEDGIACYHYLINSGVSPSDLIVWGESLGGAVATHIAASAPCSRLVLLCTFSSLDDIITYKYNRGLAILASLLIDTLPSKRRIADVTCPVMIFHSEEDEVIPYQCAKILLDSVTHPTKRLITIHGTHASPKINQNQIAQLISFCQLNDGAVAPTTLVEWLNDLEQVARRHHLI